MGGSERGRPPKFEFCEGKKRPRSGPSSLRPPQIADLKLRRSEGAGPGGWQPRRGAGPGGRQPPPQHAQSLLQLAPCHIWPCDSVAFVKSYEFRALLRTVGERLVSRVSTCIFRLCSCWSCSFAECGRRAVSQSHSWRRNAIPCWYCDLLTACQQR